ncbi:glycosyltransferase family 2 protein [Acuticoccus sp.]|uniref:glycosyltransferase family 2 protein n=1 Tax=Acuticoccus sp. TaxID=1904378 RepID=UPI003B526E6A
MRAFPTISVLIPCRNAAPYLEEALASVARQDWPNLDVVLVDDGSTDGSPDIAAAWPRVRVLTGAASGAGAARNAALRAACGDYVIFFDADDVMGPGHLSALFDAASPVRGAIGMAQWARFRGAPSSALFPQRTTYWDAPGIDWLIADWADGLPMTQPGMFLIPRTLLDAVGGWDERLSLNDDFEFFCRLLSRSAGVRFAPAAQLHYRAGLPGSLSQRGDERALRSALSAAILGTGHVLAAEDSPRTRRAAANIVRGFDYNYYPVAPHLRRRARAHAAALGGADAIPVGPPLFHRLRRVFGWRLARRMEHALL